MAKNYHYYIGVDTGDGITLVTNRDNVNKMMFWNENEKPMEFSKTIAEEDCDCMVANFIPAFVIRSAFPIEKQFCTGGDEN